MVLFLIFVLVLVVVIWLTMFEPLFSLICRFKLSVPEVVAQKFSLRASKGGVISGLCYAVSADGLKVTVKTENKPSTPRWRRRYGMAVVSLNQRGIVDRVKWFSMTQVSMMVLLLLACFVPIESHERTLILVIYLLFTAVLVLYERSILPKQLAEGLPEVMQAASE